MITRRPRLAVATALAGSATSVGALDTGGAALGAAQVVEVVGGHSHPVVVTGATILGAAFGFLKFGPLGGVAIAAGTNIAGRLIAAQVRD